MVDDLVVGIAYAVDEQTVNKAKKSARDLQKEFTQFQKAIKNAPANSYDDDIKSINKLRDEIEKTTQAQKDLNNEKDKPGVSEQAGKASTGLGQLASGASALGGGGELAGLGDVVGAIEGFQNLGSVIGGLTPTTIALGVAVGGLALLASQYTQAMEEQRKVIEANANALRETNKTIASGASSSDLRSQLAELQRQREAEVSTLSTLTSSYDSTINQSGALGAALKIIDSREEEVITQINTSKEAVSGYDAQIQQLTNALNNSAIAANDAAAALGSNIEAQRGVIDSIAGGATSDVAQQQVAQLQTRLALEEELLSSLELQLEVVSATSPEYAILIDSIAQSRDNIAGAKSGIDAYNQALANNKFAANDAKKAAETATKSQEQSAKVTEKTAQTTERAAQDTSRAQEKAASDAQQNAEKAAQAQQKYTDAIKSANLTYKQTLQDVKLKVAQGQVDINRDLGRDLNELSVKAQDTRNKLDQDAQRAEVDAVIEKNRRIQDLNKNAFQAEENAREGRSILQIAQLRKSQSVELEQAKTEAERGREDRDRESQRAQQDAVQDLLIARRDRKRSQEESLQDLKISAQREQEQASITRKRALESANAARRSELQSLAQHQNQMLGMQRDFYQAQIGLLQNAIGSASSAGNRGGSNSRGRSTSTQRSSAQLPLGVFATSQIMTVLNQSGYNGRK